MKNIYSEILEDRRYSYEEVNFFLFEECNLRCKFCFQKNYKIRKPSIEMLDHKLTLMKKLIKESSKQIFEIQMMGGELFYDELLDVYFEKYFDILDEVNTFAKSLNKTTNFVITSNLVHTKHERVFKLLNKCKDNDIKLRLASSFDLVDRFKTNEELRMFYESCLVYKEHLSTFSFLLNKPNIEVLMKKRKCNNDALIVFEKLYNEGFHISQEFYSPFSKNYKEYNISELEFLEFLYFVIDKYPNLKGVHEFDELSHSPFCHKLTFISSEHGIVKGNCIACSNAEMRQLAVVEDVNSNEQLEEAFMKEKGCLVCPHLDFCKMGCFVFFGFKDRKRLNTCIFRCVRHYLLTGNKLDVKEQ